MNNTPPSSTLKIAEDMTITRMGFGAMQLAGPGVFGPPKDKEAALATLKEVIALGINHIDTSDFYGPFVVNELIKEALHPYPDNLHIVTKVGAKRNDEGAWLPALGREELISAVHDNLNHLGLDVLDIVNLRISETLYTANDSIAEPFGVLAELQQQGLIRHLGVSTVTADQLSEAQKIAPVVCVQNLYNLSDRSDDELVDRCAEAGIAYIPYFPLGGFTPLQSEILTRVADRLGVSPQQLALAWLLQRSPTIALIPGTSSVEHLHDNIDALNLNLPEAELNELNSI